MSNRKRFDRDLYNECNDAANYHFRDQMPKKYNCVEGKKKTDVDVAVFQDLKHVFNAEVEIKKVWGDLDFPYEDVNLPERKRKYCELDLPTLFCIFNKEGNRVKCVWSDKVLKSDVAEVPNKHVWAGEYFFKIKLEDTFDSIEEALKDRGYDT